MKAGNHYRDIEQHGETGDFGARKSPFIDLFLFTASFGWQGPLGMYYGLHTQKTGIIMFGIFISIFFWGYFCLKYLIACLVD